MSDTPVYVVANFIVHDAAAYREYEKGFFPILKAPRRHVSYLRRQYRPPLKARALARAAW